MLLYLLEQYKLGKDIWVGNAGPYIGVLEVVVVQHKLLRDYATYIK